MPTPPPRIPVHLPPQPTRLIGREDELAFLRSLLAQDDVRLLTLIGPGGVGKTRLALAAAEQVAERFPDGVWFVDLAPLADPALVVPTIARVVGCPSSGAGSLAALTTFLEARSVLLVVDNLEHLLAAAADLDALLAGVPKLTVLATSREPLHLRREQVVEVHPCRCPAPSMRPGPSPTWRRCPPSSCSWRVPRPRTRASSCRRPMRRPSPS